MRGAYLLVLPLDNIKLIFFGVFFVIILYLFVVTNKGLYVFISIV